MLAGSALPFLVLSPLPFSTLIPCVLAMADEGVALEDVIVADSGSEAVAEPLFAYGLSRLDWDDLMHASMVSYGWNQGVNSALSTSPVATKLYQAKYPKEDV